MKRSVSEETSVRRNSPMRSACPQLDEPANQATVWGTGLLTLDVVISLDARKAPRLWAGGTCGNVLTILSYLGWQSFPVARLNGDAASAYVLRDLRRWGVRLDFAREKPEANTPIIVHQISRNRAGEPSHKFSWSCPRCGTWLPAYKAVLATAAGEISAQTASAQVFFFDRISRGALTLAQTSAEKGALVVFEPAGVGDPRLFREAISVAHIVKYAAGRASAIGDLTDYARPLIEIETQGREGLRYRCNLAGFDTSWQHLTAYSVTGLKDAAGAGDWCTAGLLHCIGQDGLGGIKHLTAFKLRNAFRLGQALAAWTCGFEGARGGMYRMDRQTFRSTIAEIMQSESCPRVQNTSRTTAAGKMRGNICPACERNR